MRPGYIRDEDFINPEANLGSYGFPLLCFQNVRYSIVPQTIFKNQNFPEKRGWHSHGMTLYTASLTNRNTVTKNGLKISLGSFHESWLCQGQRFYKPRGDFRFLWVPPPRFPKCEVINSVSDYLQKKIIPKTFSTLSWNDPLTILFMLNKN